MVKFLKKRWYIVVLIILLIGGFIYQKRSVQIKGTSSTKPYTVQRQTLKDTLSLSGAVDADEKATVGFLTAGKVVWVGVKEGDMVKKYQGLASMDTRDVNGRIQKYLNTYAKTRSVFDQTKEDNQSIADNGLSPSLREQAKRLIDQAQGDLNNSVLDLEIQNLAKESSYLSSPIDGIVTKAPFSVSNLYISVPAQDQFEIINPDTIFFSASADQTDVVKLSEGMSGQIVFDSYPDTEIPATVQTIGFTPQENETGTAYEVKMNFNPGGLKYKIGMTGDATFTLKEKPDVIVIPESYIKTEGKTSYVLKLTKGKLQKQFIEVGDKVEGDAEVISGLLEGDQIYD